MRQTVSLDGGEAFEIEHRVEVTVGRRVAVDCGRDVRAERRTDLRIVLERVGIGLPDQLGGDVGVVEALGHTMGDRGLQRVVVQDRGIDESADLRLVADDGVGLVADFRPDRIELVQRSERAEGLDRARSAHKVNVATEVR